MGERKWILVENGKRSIVGTDIEEVKRKNAQSGMSYNEAKAYIAKTSGGHGTAKYSDTNMDEVREKNKPEH